MSKKSSSVQNAEEREEQAPLGEEGAHKSLWTGIRAHDRLASGCVVDLC